MRWGRHTQEALFQWALKTLMHTLCIHVPPSTSSLWEFLYSVPLRVRTPWKRKVSPVYAHA